MLSKKKRSFLLVARIKTRTIVLVADGPLEKKEKDNRMTDSVLSLKHKELVSQYPFSEYDVIITRSDNLETLKKDFPEFCGWKYATHEYFR